MTFEHESLGLWSLQHAFDWFTVHSCVSHGIAYSVCRSFVPRVVTGADESERIILIRLNPWYWLPKLPEEALPHVVDKKCGCCDTCYSCGLHGLPRVVFLCIYSMLEHTSWGATSFLRIVLNELHLDISLYWCFKKILKYISWPDCPLW